MTDARYAGRRTGCFETETEDSAEVKVNVDKNQKEYMLREQMK